MSFITEENGIFNSILNLKFPIKRKLDDIENKQKSELVQKCKQFKINLFHNNCYESSILNNSILEDDMLNYLLVFVFSKFLKILLNDHSESVNNDHKKLGIDIIESLCEKVQPILIYIAVNRGFVDQTKKVFGLYYMFCDFRSQDFLTEYRMLYVSNEHSTLYQINMNRNIIRMLYSKFRSIAGTNLDEVYTNSECTNICINFVIEINTILTTYNSNQSLPFKTSTLIDWIRGKYIFKNENWKPNSDMKVVQLTKTVVDDVSMNLAQAYDLMMMCDSNAKNIWDFHKILMTNLKQIMNEYVFRYVCIIKKYLETNKQNVTSEIFENLIKIFIMYEDWTNSV